MRGIFNHPAIQLGVFTLGWAVVEPLGAAAGVPLYQVVWTRYAVHIAFMALIFGPRHGFELVRSPRLGRQIFRSLLMLGMPLSFIWAVKGMEVQDVLSVFWLAPILIVIMSAFTDDPRTGVWTLLATAGGFIGALLIFRPNAGVFHHRAVLAFGMSFCFALYVVLTRAMRNEAVLAKLFHTALWVFLSLTIVLPLFWQTPPLRGLLAMIGIGIFGGFSLYMLDRAVDAMPTAVLAPVFYSQLAWDILLRWSTHMMRTPDVRTIVGMVLAFAAAIPALLWRPNRTIAPSTASAGAHP